MKMSTTLKTKTLEEKREQLVLYRKLILGRLAEETVRREYPKDQIKTAVHLGIGQEAIPVGVTHVLPKGTKMFGTYRNHVLFLALTEDTDAFFAELYGRATAPSKGKSGGMHICCPEQGLLGTSAVVGTPIPLAVGAALANAYRQSRDYVAVFFGDGAVEEGVFWESFNFACLHRLRIFFVCEDNDLAIHTFKQERQAFQSIAEVVKGFNCHVASGEGSNLLHVISSTEGLLKAIEEDPKPAFLHLTYFRFLEHCGPGQDFNVGYRGEPSREELEKLDPVLNLEKALLQNGCSWEELGKIRSEVTEKIEQSLQRAQAAPFPAAEELYTDVYHR